jgi:molecular chaperone Hsp33
VAVVLEEVVQEAVRRHKPSPLAGVALGRTLVAGGLLFGFLRPAVRINLQLLGGGPLGALMVDARGDGSLRAYVRNAGVGAPWEAGTRPSLGRAMGTTGLLNLLWDPHGDQFFQGTCSFVTGEIDDEVRAYFSQSAQTPTAVGTEVGVDGQRAAVWAAGILVQALPDGTPDLALAADQRLLGGGLTALLAGRTPARPEDVVSAVLPGEVVRVVEEHPLAWRCGCSPDRVAGAIAMLGQEQVAEMLRDQGMAEVTCEFCRTRHVVGRDQLTALLAELRDKPGPGTGVQ